MEPMATVATYMHILIVQHMWVGIEARSGDTD